jgi:DHA2 family multidrug resistance protein
MSPVNPVFSDRQAAITHGLAPLIGHSAAGSAANGILYGQLLQQSALGAYIDNFRLLALLCIVCLPFLFLFRKSASRKGPMAGH